MYVCMYVCVCVCARVYVFEFVFHFWFRLSLCSLLPKAFLNSPPAQSGMDAASQARAETERKRAELKAQAAAKP